MRAPPVPRGCEVVPLAVLQEGRRPLVRVPFAGGVLELRDRKSVVGHAEHRVAAGEPDDVDDRARGGALLLLERVDPRLQAPRVNQVVVHELVVRHTHNVHVGRRKVEREIVRVEGQRPEPEQGGEHWDTRGARAAAAAARRSPRGGSPV